MSTPSLESAFEQSPQRIILASNGNSPWAQAYAETLRDTVVRRASRQDRNMQRRLGPSGLDYACDRKLVAEMAGARVDEGSPQESINHISDPWASIVGTAIHAWLEDAFRWDNEHGPVKDRWLPECKVTPDPGSELPHPGTADLYDTLTRSLIDHKGQSESVRDKLRRNGPPQHYFGQMLLYAVGYMHLGYEVDRVVLASWPRTKSSLDDMYIWEHEITAADIQYVIDLIEKTKVREEVSKYVADGRLTWRDIPATPSDEACHYCLTGDTEVLTRDGIKQISSLAGTSPKLLVPGSRDGSLMSSGTFQEHPVRYLGQQPTYNVVLTRARQQKTVTTTAEHRWVTETRSHGLWKQEQGVRTEDLRPGDLLKGIRRASPSMPDLMRVAVAQGFTFGDGTSRYNDPHERPASVTIYDNGKDDMMRQYFDSLYGLPRFWKRLPPLDESRSFLLSWLAGYFAADGCVSKGGQPSIASARKENIEFVRSLAEVCGVRHGGIKVTSRVGIHATEATDLFEMQLTRRDLPEWFFLIEEHSRRAAVANEKPVRSQERWRVVSVTPTGRAEPVYCATVEGTEAFALSDGLLTMNCPLYRPQAAYDPEVTGCPGAVEIRY